MVLGRRPSKTRGFLRFLNRLVDLRKLVVFCDFQLVWAGRPSKTRGFLRFSNRSRDPLRTLGWSTFENSWFFAIFESPARSSADFGLVNLRKLVVFCSFLNRPCDPLRTLGWSTFENSWFFAIFKSPARPSADFRLVGPRKLVVFCDFQIARATLYGLWAGRTCAFCDLDWSTFRNTWFFAIFTSPARPSTEFRGLSRSHCGAARIFLRP